MSERLVRPWKKLTNHAPDGEPATGDEDQNQAAGVEGKAVVSIDGVVCESSTMVCSSLHVGRRQPVPPRLAPTPAQYVLALAQVYAVDGTVCCQVSLVLVS
jgi:hypothetical protein